MNYKIFLIYHSSGILRMELTVITTSLQKERKKKKYSITDFNSCMFLPAIRRTRPVLPCCSTVTNCCDQTLVYTQYRFSHLPQLLTTPGGAEVENLTSLEVPSVTLSCLVEGRTHLSLHSHSRLGPRCRKLKFSSCYKLTYIENRVSQPRWLP